MMTKQQTKGLVAWATVQTKLGTRTTSRLNPQTLDPKNIIIVAPTLAAAREYQRAINAPANVRAHALDELHVLAGRVYGVQAIYWHPDLTQGQVMQASAKLMPTMHDALPLLPDNFYPLERQDQ